MAATICVQERLPPGAAGVLINQTHIDRDLILPIHADEKRWLDAMDGVRSIGEIVERTPQVSLKNSRSGAVRSFFEQLWRYDQVVFDASACTAAKL